MIISEELLSEVLGKKVIAIDGLTHIHLPNNIFFFVEGDVTGNINIHELAHKVKEWATENGIVLESSTYKSKAVCHTMARTHNNEIYYPEIFEEATEPEAIFKAGAWILENKDV